MKLKYVLWMSLGVAVFPLMLLGVENKPHSARYWLDLAEKQIGEKQNDADRIACVIDVASGYFGSSGKLPEQFRKRYVQNGTDEIRMKLVTMYMYSGHFDKAILGARALSNRYRQRALYQIAMAVYRMKRDIPRALKLASELEKTGRLYVAISIAGDLALRGKEAEARKVASKMGADIGGLISGRAKLVRLLSDNVSAERNQEVIRGALKEMRTSAISEARMLSLTGHADMAFRLLQWAEKFEKVGSGSLAPAYVAMARNLRDKKDKELALQVLAKAMFHIEKVELARMRAFRLLDVAELQVDFGENKAALQTVERTVALVLNLPDHFERAKILCHLTGTQVSLKDVTAAGRLLKLAEEASKRDSGHILITTMVDSYVVRLLEVGREEDAMAVMLENISGNKNEESARRRRSMEESTRSALDSFGRHYGYKGKTDQPEDLLKKLKVPRQRIALLLGLARGASAREQIAKAKSSRRKTTDTAPSTRTKDQAPK